MPCCQWGGTDVPERSAPLWERQGRVPVQGQRVLPPAPSLGAGLGAAWRSCGAGAAQQVSPCSLSFWGQGGEEEEGRSQRVALFCLSPVPVVSCSGRLFQTLLMKRDALGLGGGWRRELAVPWAGGTHGRAGASLQPSASRGDGADPGCQLQLLICPVLCCLSGR